MRLEALLKGVDFDTVCGTLDKEAGTLITIQTKAARMQCFSQYGARKQMGINLQKKQPKKV